MLINVAEVEMESCSKTLIQKLENISEQHQSKVILLFRSTLDKWCGIKQKM